VSFYIGISTSAIVISNTNDTAEDRTNRMNANIKRVDETRRLKLRVMECEREVAEFIEKELKCGEDVDGDDAEKSSNVHDLLEKDVRKLAAAKQGMARVNAEDFHSNLDYGYPADYNKQSEVLMLYVNAHAKPDGMDGENAAVEIIPKLSFEDSTKKCEALNVVTVQASEGKATCVALTGGYESFHVQRWMRSGQEEKNGESPVVNLKNPLRHVSRGMQRNGVDQFHPPNLVDIHKHWGPLRRYFESYDAVTAELKPLLSRIAINKTVIVMVCNMGQASLLMNFACSAKSRGLEVGNVLVFATDEETKRMAEGLGLTAFYDEQNFGDMPAQEAGSYGDKKFVAMMYAKVVCVQLVNMLGYDVLFQDVDIVWYKNPLDVFHDDTSELSDFDLLFQDDGARSIRYAPYSANSGFYYVRHNKRTRYLFTSLLYSSDLIAALHSHQQVLTAFITEHSSLFGTRVKTLDGSTFPGGYHYHRQKSLMEDIVKGTYVPWLFHMSWTKNKDNKLKFFKQMGLWYLKEQCEVYENISQNTNMMEQCCSVEPIISCHYRDKPSIHPCKDSPPIDKGRPSFWK